jgi:hypothetical protein
VAVIGGRAIGVALALPPARHAHSRRDRPGRGEPARSLRYYGDAAGGREA